ncbi:MAG: VWA domain-containing protein [Candidatus Latescibacteria bacterium]|nr:VWA domain-containing protein [Candidatus Latescibacterota bacterium]
MRFAYPLNFWLLLLLPLLGGLFVWARRRQKRDLGRFAQSAIMAKLADNVSRSKQVARYGLAWAGVAFLLLAMTGPQFGTKLAIAQRKGVDVVFLLDLSRSMLAQDSKPSRLAQAKYQIGQLLDQLEGDRVGLVVFAGRAFVQCPLTLDHGAVRLFLDTIDTESMPVQGTAIGEAIGLANRCFDEGERRFKTMVLFTDGEDHQGDPVGAAERAAAEGARIFAVGLGTPAGELIPGQVADGASGYHKDRRGNYVKSRLDEESLKQIALVAEGDYFRSTTNGGEIEEIATQIKNMDQKELGETRFTEYEERFQIPLLAALACLMAAAWLSDRRASGKEWKGRFA